MLDVENKIAKALKQPQSQGKKKPGRLKPMATFEWIKNILKANARFLRLICLTRVKKKDII